MNFEYKPKIEMLEGEQKFHFEEIAEIEQALISLLEQLKEKIENAEYDTLISDDVGGRIPTLILKKIIKKCNPNQELETFFIASGKTYLPTAQEENYETLKEYLKKITHKTKKALIITQFIFSGDTIIKLAKALEEVGIKNFDIASVDSTPRVKEDILQNIPPCNDLYIGSEDWHQLHEEHQKLSGVKKTKDYSPFPKRMVDVTDKEGREIQEAEWKKIFGIEQGDYYEVIKQKLKDEAKNKEFEERIKTPLTPEEIKEIQKNINFAREDADLMANKVFKKVWHK